MSETLGIGSQRRESQHDLGWAVYGHHVLELIHVKETRAGTEKPAARTTPKKGKGLFIFYHL